VLITEHADEAEGKRKEKELITSIRGEKLYTNRDLFTENYEYFWPIHAITYKMLCAVVLRLESLEPLNFLWGSPQRRLEINLMYVTRVYIYTACAVKCYRRSTLSRITYQNVCIHTTWLSIVSSS